MSTITGILSSLTRSIVERTINAMPSHTKRLLFITSLAGYFTGLDKINSETLHKLNTAMALCSREGAMEIPVLLSKTIWHGKTSYEIFSDKFSSEVPLSEDRAKQISTYVLSVMPKWLQYGDSDTIIKDVERLLMNMSRFTPA